MNKRVGAVILCITIVGLAVTAAGITYTKWRRETALQAIELHRDKLHNLLNNIGTGINFIEVYDEYNDSLLNERINSKEQEVRNQDIHINYDVPDIESDSLKLGDYIQIEEVRINNIEQSKFEYKTRFMGSYTKFNKDKFEITLKLNTDYASLDNTIASLAEAKIVKKMHGASGRMINGKMELTSSGQVGRTYNRDKLSKDVQSGSLNIEIEAVDIPVYPSENDILSITDKLSSFTTGYSSSSSSRKQNIKVGAGNINGTLLLPGEVLSVDKGMKSRNKANGYEKAGSYLNGETIQTYGGGICQVSTTLYGAILRAGVIPIERNAHSMSVGYVPLGLDAAVSEGSKDLKIKNTYNSPIYIESITNGSSLTFNVYGKPGLMEGYTYIPESSSSNNRLRAKSWLNKVKDGVEVGKVSLFSSVYRPHN